jgi:D-lactate dehydrogenase (cytochrome)
MLYPPDPTERGCFLGGTVSTNASGARTFKYGPTRTYIQRLKMVLASGEVLELRRGELKAKGDRLRIPLPSGSVIEARLPELPEAAYTKERHRLFCCARHGPTGSLHRQGRFVCSSD